MSVDGYRYGDTNRPTSPVTPAELDQLKATLLWSDEDDRALRRAGAVLATRADDVLDVWYGFVGDTPHLLAHFSDPQGQPIAEYLDRVRDRFRLWIHDTCNRPFDQTWLDYQHQIALRHHTQKNETDDVTSTALIPARYLIAFVVPLSVTMRPFLAAGGDDDERVEAMQTAWLKAVTLTAALWSQPYAGDAW